MTTVRRITVVVDDNAIQAATRKTILERAEQKVAVATDGRAAIRLIESPEVLQRVGLVISDHLMPGMSGPELVTQIRAILPYVPILILSGWPDAEEEYRGLSIIFRCKPFPPHDLITLTREMLLEPLARTA